MQVELSRYCKLHNVSWQSSSGSPGGKAPEKVLVLLHMEYK